MNKTYLTAISRKNLSIPAKWLLKQNLISSDHLDYGCGRGSDAEYLGCDKYDPYYFPDKPTKRYDSITCTYVLNVLETHTECQDVVNSIRELLTENGKGYISVRRDIKNEGITSRGTYQYMVYLSDTVLVENSSFALYEILPYSKLKYI